jgi:hypothetical protein
MSTPQPVSEEEFVGRLTDVQKDTYCSVEGEEQCGLILDLLEAALPPGPIVEVDASSAENSSLTAEQSLVLEERLMETSGSSTCVSHAGVSDQFGRLMITRVFPVYKFVADEEAEHYGSRLCKKVFLALGEEMNQIRWLGGAHRYLHRAKKTLNAK